MADKITGTNAGRWIAIGAFTAIGGFLFKKFIEKKNGNGGLI